MKSIKAAITRGIKQKLARFGYRGPFKKKPQGKAVKASAITDPTTISKRSSLKRHLKRKKIDEGYTILMKIALVALMPKGIEV